MESVFVAIGIGGDGSDEATDLDISYTKVATTQVFAKYNKATNFTVPKACK